MTGYNELDLSGHNQIYDPGWSRYLKPSRIMSLQSLKQKTAEAFRMFVACGCKHINASMSLICSPFHKSAWIELQHWGLLKSLKGNLIGRVGWFLLDRVCQKNANALTAKQICSVKFLCRHFWEWQFLLKSRNRALRSLGILSHAQSCSCAGILGHAHVLIGPSMSNVTTIYSWSIRINQFLVFSQFKRPWLGDNGDIPPMSSPCSAVTMAPAMAYCRASSPWQDVVSQKQALVHMLSPWKCASNAKVSDDDID